MKRFGLRVIYSFIFFIILLIIMKIFVPKGMEPTDFFNQFIGYFIQAITSPQIFVFFILSLVSGVLFMKFIYPQYASMLVKIDLIVFYGENIISILVALLWFPVIILVSFTPLLEFNSIAILTAWMWTMFPFSLVVFWGMKFDRIYNVCPSCGYYGGILNKGTTVTSDKQTEYTAKFKDGSKKAAGTEIETTYEDERVCNNCDYSWRQSHISLSGNRKYDMVKNKSDGTYSSNTEVESLMGATKGFLNFFQPYRLYLLYKKIGILK